MLNGEHHRVSNNHSLNNNPDLSSVHIRIWNLDDENNPDAGMEPGEVSVFIVFGVMMTILLIVALVVNLTCVLKTRQIAYSRPSLYLVINLNACDILVALMTWIQFMVQQISRTQNFTLHIIVHKVLLSTLISLGNVTILTLLGLAFDIYSALRFPLHYNSSKTRKYVRAILVLTWIVSVSLGFCDFIEAVILYLDKENKMSYYEILRDTIVHRVTNTISNNLLSSFTILLSNITSFLCLILMISIYSYILTKIHRSMKSNTKRTGGVSKQTKAFHTTLMIFLSFILLWIPTLVSNILSVMKPDYLSRFSLLEASIIGYTADALLVVHSIVDGVIYGLRVERQRTIQKAQQLSIHSQKTLRDSSTVSSVKAKSMDSGLTSVSGSVYIRRMSFVSAPNLDDRLDTITERSNGSRVDNNNIDHDEEFKLEYSDENNQYDEFITASNTLHHNPAELIYRESFDLHREVLNYMENATPNDTITVLNPIEQIETELIRSQESTTTKINRCKSIEDVDQGLTAKIQKNCYDSEEMDTDSVWLESTKSEHNVKSILQTSSEESVTSDENISFTNKNGSSHFVRNPEKLVRICSKVLFSPEIKRSPEGIINRGFRRPRIGKVKQAKSIQEDYVVKPTGILKNSPLSTKAASFDETFCSSYQQPLKTETREKDVLSKLQPAATRPLNEMKNACREETSVQSGKLFESTVVNLQTVDSDDQSERVSECTKM